MIHLFRDKIYQEFIEDFPVYKKTNALDKLRKKEYSRLDKNKQIYLDYTGGNLYTEGQVKKHLSLLLHHTFGNPHSTNPTSQLSTTLVATTRQYVLQYFNAQDDYFCIFTPNASGALKIVGESYPFGKNSFLLLSLDNHNSVNGIREFAKKKGSEFRYAPLHISDLKLNEEELYQQLDAHPNCDNKLFAFPAQSNVSGVKHPLDYVKQAQDKGWDVLLDAAAFVPTNKLDLQQVQPDFASVSFYKIFGYPTGLGCLLLRKTKFDKLVKPWYAGGTISMASATYDSYFLMPNHERFEDGTLNYLDIPAIKIGLEYIEGVGMDIINKRVQSLAGWLLKKLSDLRHHNGKPLIKIFGPDNMNARGGTLVMNFYNQEGVQYPYTHIESEANKKNISIRTGCFCNPGVDETTNCILPESLEEFFGAHSDGNFRHMMEVTGYLRGSVRISLGLASNFNDVLAFYHFARTFLNR